ncbi:hypothetical protein [Chitinibacter tainanensis]|uniref:hypothetical protein n=1 Tax=Chitinibacter tainanensis TaxID=230667 RepID=UPI00040ECAD4|nr:hypothetical protein [Chitinibacter tainanensis]
MAKYQFFQRGSGHSKEVRYLSTERSDFLAAKEALLAAGFEVHGDMIYAADDASAIAHFNSGMIYPLEEYNKAHSMGGLYYFLTGIASSIRQYWARRAS